jgi:hypothetical protein
MRLGSTFTALTTQDAITAIEGAVFDDCRIVRPQSDMAWIVITVFFPGRASRVDSRGSVRGSAVDKFGRTLCVGYSGEHRSVRAVLPKVTPEHFRRVSHAIHYAPALEPYMRYYDHRTAHLVDTAVVHFGSRSSGADPGFEFRDAITR